MNWFGKKSFNHSILFLIPEIVSQTGLITETVESKENEETATL